jgi:hypothetical protein
MGTEPESVYAQKGTMKDVLARFLKKTKDQVYCLKQVYCCDGIFKMYIVHCTYMITPPPTLLIVVPIHISCKCIIKGVYFSQVKSKP